jgi:hypothetical protein
MAEFSMYHSGGEPPEIATVKPLTRHQQATHKPAGWEMRSYSLRIRFVFASYSLRILFVFCSYSQVLPSAALRRFHRARPCFWQRRFVPYTNEIAFS